ncbi:MAG: hypothetical protein UT24_C0025G0012 [Candidatus Woesebacteria bacterium GW2011_GWB1_39_12]|uniref:Uncharacterized protein n=2 Tax=Candidatus Woeseibacteriota TaxID=1752722 RepID=A0A0G0PID7_9BACT|nr:MAG: hypothetical protein UT23_C0007G0012 [Candidatus Woesebacteria bacterium GW2011_GWA1_39_12]KKQ99295.1 MAG: hypothetical protein UT24_C0025G0012 [Candidatus Woesebacteria bacterium GW2011_GWB1_39_12]
MTQEVVRSEGFSPSSGVGRVRTILNETAFGLSENGNSLIRNAWGLVYDSSLIKGIREELEEIRYDLRQKPGNPPIY